MLETSNEMTVGLKDNCMQQRNIKTAKNILKMQKKYQKYAKNFKNVSKIAEKVIQVVGLHGAIQQICREQQKFQKRLCTMHVVARWFVITYQRLMHSKP